MRTGSPWERRHGSAKAPTNTRGLATFRGGFPGRAGLDHTAIGRVQKREMPRQPDRPLRASTLRFWSSRLAGYVSGGIERELATEGRPQALPVPAASRTTPVRWRALGAPRCACAVHPAHHRHSSVCQPPSQPRTQAACAHQSNPRRARRPRSRLLWPSAPRPPGLDPGRKGNVSPRKEHEGNLRPLLQAGERSASPFESDQDAPSIGTPGADTGIAYGA